MANLNLVFLGVLVGAAGGTIGLLVLILIHHELFVHRRPRVVIAFVLLITGLSVLSDGGVAALALCVFSAVCFYGLGLVLRGVLFGDIPSASSDRLPPRPFVRQRRPLNGFQLAKLVAFLALLVAMIVAAKRSYQVHLQEHQPGPSYLEVIKDIESDID